MTRTVRSTETLAREVLEGLCSDLMDLAQNNNHLVAWHAARGVAQTIEETVDQVIRTIENRRFEAEQMASVAPELRPLIASFLKGGAA